MPTRVVVASMLWLLLCQTVSGKDDTEEQAREFVTAGQPSEAIVLLLQQLKEADASEQRLELLWLLSDTYVQQGDYHAAWHALDQAQRVSGDERSNALTLLRMGAVQSRLGNHEAAFDLLMTAESSKPLLDGSSKAALFLELGNVLVFRRQFSEAVAYFDRAADQASIENASSLQARALANGMRARLDSQDIEELNSRLDQLSIAIARIKKPSVQAELYMSQGLFYQRAVNEFGYPVQWRGIALEKYQKSLALAADPAQKGYAYGFIGALYEDQKQIAEALTATRLALFQAQLANAGSQAYRWEWQLGRLLLEQGNVSAAQAAYQRSVDILGDARTTVVNHSPTAFSSLVAPVYREYADLALAQPAGDKDEQSRRLSIIREQLETLKEAEIEDYFQNQCVTATEKEPAQWINDSNAAVIYPVFLDERIEILVQVRGRMEQLPPTPKRRLEVEREIRKLRVALENPNSISGYLESATQVYDWLIRPAEAILRDNNIDTLVIVPEGPLRTIPLSALHDGQQFLIERFAIATTPALSLLQRLDSSDLESLLVGGLSESVANYPALPKVSDEIANASSLFPSVTMENEQFLLKEIVLQLETGDFSIAHFATHGDISSDYRESFLLAHDGRLTLSTLQSALRSRQGEPLDLLVLSACKTAVDDERAALGLAGVAVQSGARSALASLWYIGDEVTASLIAKFYDSLKTDGLSKAQSLRQAQLAVLRGEQFSHPSYWAPFLLIGNWL